MGEEIKKYKTYLANDIASRYQIDTREANEIVEKSAINHLLAKYPELIMHDPISSTSHNVWNEHMGLPTEQ